MTGLLALLLAAPLPLSELPKACARPPADARFLVDLVDAPVADVARIVACFSGRNLVLSGEPKGKVTVYGPTPVTRDEAVWALRGAIDDQGFLLAERGKYLVLQPVKAAAAQPNNLGKPARGPRRVTALVRLEHVTPDEASHALASLATKDAQLVGYAPGNLLLITERGDNLRRLLGLLEKLDRPTDRAGLRIYTLLYADATVVAGHAKALLDEDTRITVDERTNRLFVKATRQQHADLARTLAMLDVAEGNDRQARVVLPQHGKAAELQKVIDALRRQER